MWTSLRGVCRVVLLVAGLVIVRLRLCMAWGVILVAVLIAVGMVLVLVGLVTGVGIVCVLGLMIDGIRGVNVVEGLVSLVSVLKRVTAVVGWMTFRCREIWPITVRRWLKLCLRDLMIWWLIGMVFVMVVLISVLTVRARLLTVVRLMVCVPFPRARNLCRRLVAVSWLLVLLCSSVIVLLVMLSRLPVLLMKRLIRLELILGSLSRFLFLGLLT